MEKRCPKCKEYKLLELFNKSKNRKDGVQAYCRICQAIIDRHRYDFHIDLKKKQLSSKTRRRIIKKQLQEYKSQHGCATCGNKDFRVIDFHHLRDKIFSVSIGIAKGYSIKRIMSEVEKCQCLCANCHRIVTYYQLYNDDLEY